MLEMEQGTSMDLLEMEPKVSQDLKDLKESKEPKQILKAPQETKAPQEQVKFEKPPLPPMRSSSYSPLTIVKTSRPTSRSLPSRPMSVNDSPRISRLFEKCKEDIYRSAANLISNFESEPYFLMSVFKKLLKLDSSYLRQKVLMQLDELLEENEVEEEQETEESMYPKEIIQEKVTRTQVEDLIRSRVSLFLSDLLTESQNVTINKTILDQLYRLVVGILHSSLYALMDHYETMEDVEVKEDKTSFLM